MEDNNNKRNTFKEEMELKGSELIERIKKLVKEGNVRKLIVKNQIGEVLLEIPLTAGVVVGGVFVLAAPLLAAIGALAGFMAKIKLEVIRTNNTEE